MTQQPSEFRVNASSLVRGGSWSLASRVISAVLALAAGALLTRLAEPNVVGRYFVVVAVAGFAGGLGTLGMGKAITALAGRAWAQNAASVRTTIRRGLIVGGLGTGLICSGTVILGLTWDQLREWIDLRGAIWWLTAGLIAFVAVQSLVIESVRALGEIRSASLWQLAIPNTALAGSLLLIWLSIGRASVAGLIGVFAVATALSVIGGVVALVRRLDGFPLVGGDPPQYRSYLRIGLPWIGILLLYQVLTQWGTVMTVFLGSEADAAVYATSLGLALWVAVPVSIVEATIPPYVVRLSESRSTKRLEALMRSAATMAALPAGAAVLLFAVGGDWLLTRLYGPFYGSGHLVLVLLALGQFAVSVAGSSSLLLSLTGHQRVVLVAALAAVIATVGAIALLGPRFGPTAVAAANAGGIAVWGAAVSMCARRRLGIRTWAKFALVDVAAIGRDVRRALTSR